MSAFCRSALLACHGTLLAAFAFASHAEAGQGLTATDQSTQAINQPGKKSFGSSVAFSRCYFPVRAGQRQRARTMGPGEVTPRSRVLARREARAERCCMI